MADLFKFTTDELKSQVHAAVRSNDRVKIAELTVEIKKRIIAKGGTPPTELTKSKAKLAALKKQRDLVMKGK
jgi:replication initiation and membrane attachment protein DnaB